MLAHERASLTYGVRAVDIGRFKYRAFLSYSHHDVGWARWLHARLEGFHFDKDLIGREAPLGPVPSTLRPIFRDREDFSGGQTLTDATVVALDASPALIVLCSPVAASRPAVNEEARLFRSRHPERPVIPVIVDGTAPDNFPPALRFELTADGSVTDRPVTILGPDLREAADGKNLGLAKIVAGLTGLSPDDIFHRAERARRRQNRLRMTVAAVIAVLTVVGSGFYWQSHEQKQTLNEIAALVEKYSAVTQAQAAVPRAKQRLTAALTAIAEGAATDPRYAQALALLKANKPAEAEPLLKAVAEDKAKRADKDAKDAAAAYRTLASIAAVSDPGRARHYYAEAARLDPSDVEGMFLSGLYQENAGQLDAAQQAYTRVIAMAKPGSDDEALIWAQFGTGDIQQQRGNLGAALTTYQGAQATIRRLTQSDPGNTLWQRDLAVSYDYIGGVQMAQGNLAGTRKSYRVGLAIRRAIVANGGSNVQWQKDLQFSIGRIGDLAFKFILARDFDNALQSADQVILLAPDEVWLYANRGHALMFLGREDEARALYLRYRDEKKVLGKPWDTVILEDFAEMRKAGLMNPLMDEITKLFAR